MPNSSVTDRPPAVLLGATVQRVLFVALSVAGLSLVLLVLTLFLHQGDVSAHRGLVFVLLALSAVSIASSLVAVVRIRLTARARFGTLSEFEALLQKAQAEPELLDTFTPPPGFGSAVAQVQRILFDLHDKRRQAESTANHLIATQNRLELLLQETREYAAARELYETSFDVVPVGILVCDENHRVVDVNPAFFDMTGFTKEELVGRDYLGLFHDEDRALAEALVASIEEGAEDGVAEWRGLRRDGDSYQIEARGCLIARGENRARHVVLFIDDVTGHRRAETEIQLVFARQQELIEEQKLFRYVFESNLVGMAICDARGAVEKANQRFADIGGWPLAVLAEQSWLSMVHPDDRAEVEATFQRAIRGRGVELKLNTRLIRQDETQVEVLVHGRAQYSSRGAFEWFALLIEDVTQHERAKREQSKALESLQYLLANIPDGVIDVDPSGVILSANPAAAKMFGYAERELVGSPVARVIPSFRFDASPSFRMFTGDTKGTRADGSQFDVGYNYKQRVFNGSELFTLIVYDNSMVKQLIAQLERARDAALSSSRVKSTFLATMTHELRTPLNGVLGMLDLLIGTRTTREQKDYIKTASRSGHYLLTLINNILDYSKLEAEQMVLEESEFSPREVAEEVAELAAAEARDQTIDVVLVVDARVPECVVGDAGRLRQVLTNLLGNAIKFTEQGEILLDVRQIMRHGQRLFRFEVQDSGIGIPADALDRIFDSFSQAKPSTARKYGGSGLGLSIGKQLVELMGGTLSVESNEGQGSRFFFEIPLEPVEVERPSLDLKGQQVFAVMQNRGNVAAVRGALAGTGAVIQAAQGAGRELERCRLALQEAVQSGAAPILLLDFFPNPEFAVRVLEAFSAIDPAIAMRTVGFCAFGRRTDFQTAQKCGVVSLVPKPVIRKRLLRSLAALCGLPMSSLPEETIDFAGEMVAEVQRTGRGLEVLAVDDVDVNLMVISGLLRNRGAGVTTALGGAAALELAATRPFDLVLLDCQMPGIDGFEVLRALRQNTDWGARAQIIAMTAGDTQREIERCLAAGMDGVLTKPVDAERLDALLHDAVSRKHGGVTSDFGGGGGADPYPGRDTGVEGRELASAYKALSETGAESVLPPGAPASPAAADAQPPTSSGSPAPPPDTGDEAAADVLSMDKVRELTALLPREALGELHQTFAAESRRKIDGLQAALASASREEMTALTHALKGSGYNVGAVRLGDLCREHEARLRADGALLSADEVAEIDSRLEAAIGALAVAYGLDA